MRCVVGQSNQLFLEENGKLGKLLIERVPGSNEIPSCIDLILQNSSLDCMIGLGVVIKGSTSHHHLVAESTAHSLQTLSIQYHIPIINGIVVTDDLHSAEQRIVGDIDRGLEFAQAALHMAQLKKMDQDLVINPSWSDRRQNRCATFRFLFSGK